MMKEVSLERERESEEEEEEVEGERRGGDPIRGADSSSLHVARKIKLRPREGNVNAERPDPQSEGSPVISLKHR